MPLRAHENILVFYDKLPTYNPQMSQGKPYSSTTKSLSNNYNSFTLVSTINASGERYPRDVIKFDNSNERNYHPTQKPVAMLEWLIKTYTNEGETVLDNCMGSGSTGVACIHTGRNFIGMEMNEEYFDIACKRINDTNSSTSSTVKSASSSEYKQLSFDELYLP